METRDAELVERTRAGDTEAYGELIRRYQGHVYAVAQSLSGNWTDAQDITQETFLRAFGHLDQVREPARFAGWLRRVTFGVAMNWLKAYRPGLFERLEGRVDLDTLEIPDFAPGPAEVVERRELADAVLSAVASLPARYRLPLTMFHLDGLSYQKVADFLDVPLGTAKSLVHRARAKLKEALGAYYAEELAPAVQEVFDHHKLSPAFAGQVLADLPRLGWDKGESTFCAALVAALEFLGDPVPYDFVMGVSGQAFQLSWVAAWQGYAGATLHLQEETVARTLRALGYRYDLLTRTAGAKKRLREKVLASIHAGRPVIIQDGMGPGCSLAAGLEEPGSVLVGRTFFDATDDYHAAPDWEQKWRGLLLLGGKSARRPQAEVLHEAFEHALLLSQRPDEGGISHGLAAYEAWAQDLRGDEFFPAGDLETLTQRCHLGHSLVLAAAWDARRAAAAFLRRTAPLDAAREPHLLAASEAYEAEYRLLAEAMALAPFCHDAVERRLQLADPALRAQLAEVITRAGACEARALAAVAAAMQVSTPVPLAAG